MLGLFVNDSSIHLGSYRMSSLSNPIPIKRDIRHRFLLFSFYSLSKMKATIDLEFLQGINEKVINLPVLLGSI